MKKTCTNFKHQSKCDVDFMYVCLRCDIMSEARNRQQLVDNVLDNASIRVTN